MVSRYTGTSAEEAPLHRLGGDQWDKARRKAAARIRDVAAELLELYAKRAARQTVRPATDPTRLRRLCRGLSLRAHRGSGPRHRGRRQRSRQRQADGPARLRRRGLRQDRSGAARRLHGRVRRTAGGRAGADHAAGPAALPDLRRPLRRLARDGRGAVPLPLRPGEPQGAGRGSRPAAWTSSSARTACSRATCASRTWA